MSNLANIYKEHHNNAGRRDFTYGGNERISKIKKLINNKGIIIDLGCRDGRLTHEYTRNCEVIGVDIDFEALKSGLATGRLKMAIQADLMSPLPIRNDYFDQAFCGEVLEHLPFPHFLISEINRILNIEGRFIGSVPNSFRLKNRLKFLFGKDFEDDPTHLHHFSVSDLYAIISTKFIDVVITAGVGRFTKINAYLFGNDLFWTAKKR